MNQESETDGLTIEDAADLLNVSAAFVAGLIEAGTLLVHGGGNRLAIADVLAYRDRADAVAEEALDAMTADAAGLYDE